MVYPIITTLMSSYNLADHMAEIEAKGDVSRSDWYRMLQYHEDKRRERERERERLKIKNIRNNNYTTR